MADTAAGNARFAGPRFEGSTSALEGNNDELPIFFLEGPDGTIENIAGADSVAPPPTNPRLWCHQCNTLLEFTAGASYVQCFVCRTMNAVLSGSQVGGRTMNMLCTVCNTSNLAPWGTAYVRCGQCNTVSDVTHIYSTAYSRGGLHR
jgi:LSD1 subclass zinc finger protein